MNNLQFLVSITIGEFDVLRDLGAIRIDPHRIIVTRRSSKDGYGPDVDAQLLAKLPEFRPDEEHSILILAFECWNNDLRMETSSSLLSGRVKISARECTQILPLTSRARAILASRLQGQAVLGDPVFDDLVVGHLEELQEMSGVTGAEAAIEAVIENAAEFSTGKLRTAALDPDHPRHKLVVSAFKFTRHKPHPQEPVSGVADLGTLLKDSGIGEVEKLKALGEWVRDNLEKIKGFSNLHSDQQLRQLLSRLEADWELPASATSFAIFLHWRDLALRAGGVDLDAVVTDCQELAGCVDGQTLAEAVWMLGFSSGFEAVASGCYKRMGHDHPFNPTGGKGKRVTLLSLPALEIKPSTTTQVMEERKREMEAPSSSTPAPETKGTSTAQPESVAPEEKPNSDKDPEVEQPDSANIAVATPEEPAASPEKSAGEEQRPEASDTTAEHSENDPESTSPDDSSEGKESSGTPDRTTKQSKKSAAKKESQPKKGRQDKRHSLSRKPYGNSKDQGEVSKQNGC